MGTLPLEPQLEPPRRYIVNDTTFQKLGDVLSNNPHGVLVFQDELSGLLESVSSPGQEGARAFYLTAWNGRQSYTFDRIGRGTILIPRLCLSVLGGFQPAKLKQHLGSAVIGGKHDDGMAQRFQLLVYPDQTNGWTYVDRPPQYDLMEINDVFKRLDELNPDDIGAHSEFGRDHPTIRFDNEAQALFIKLLTNLERRLRSGDLDPALESHLAKYRKLIPVMALLIHLIDVGHGPVGIAALKKAWGSSCF
jgi:putative DNA primase/helicase